MKSLIIACLCVGLEAITHCTISQAAPASANNSADANNGPSFDKSSALVQLNGDPLSTYSKTKPPSGKKIDFNSNTVKSYRAQLSALRNDFKRWLRANAPAAKMTGEYDISLNAVAVQLNGASLDLIARAPQVLSVQYQMLYHPTSEDPDLSLIHAIEAWAIGGGPANAGDGVKIAIIDTGIDIKHPCFVDTGYSSTTQLGDHRFTNNKVIAAKVFNNNSGSRGYTAEAIQEHGTHVAGTAACDFNTPAVVEGVTIPYGVSGVAPRALLGNYNVFPGDVDNARSEDILNALESAYADGFDVANLSLGGTPGKSGTLGFQDLLTIAIDNLDQADMVVAVAAGNGGPGHFTLGSPGSAARALTAGASTVPHLIATPVTVNGTSYAARAGEFATVQADLTAPLAVLTDGGSLSLACSAISADLTGKIALLSRGSCTFSTKIRNAQNAGAIAVLVANNIAGDPVGMATDDTPDQPTIPAYMIAREAGQALLGSDGASATIGATLQYLLTANADLMADFSSEGPTDVDARVKPDVVAPGVNVLSSIPVAFCDGNPCWAFLQGTSMATPHLAGSAAIVRWLYPDWTAAQVRSAIVNTADQHVLRNFRTGAEELDFNITGAGRENLLAAVNATVALDPVSVSFGAVPSGSGQTKSFAVILNNLGTSSAVYSLSVGSGGGGVSYSVSPTSVSLAANASVTVTITLSADKRAAAGDHQSTLTVSSGAGEVAHAVVYTLIK